MQNTVTTGGTLPPENDKKRNVLAIVLKVIATVVATLLGALGLQSCL